MTIAHRSISIQLRRLGREVDTYIKTQNGTDAHNNPNWDYVLDSTAICVRSYPNRNEQHDSAAGPYEDDDPVFFFPRGEEPPSDARIEYPEDADTVADATDTTTYEMRAPTKYDTHVSMFGAFVDE